MEFWAEAGMARAHRRINAASAAEFRNEEIDEGRRWDIRNITPEGKY